MEVIPESYRLSPCAQRLRVRGRSLFDVLRKAGGRVDVRLARSVAISVARGMAYLHSRQPPILHKVRAPAPI